MKHVKTLAAVSAGLLVAPAMPALTAPNTSLLNTRKSWVHQ